MFEFARVSWATVYKCNLIVLFGSRCYESTNVILSDEIKRQALYQQLECCLKLRDFPLELVFDNAGNDLDKMNTDRVGAVRRSG